MASRIWKAITRKKKFEGDSHLDTNLRRCLGLMDITFLALGQMMGAGIYVLTGTVVRNQAGPSIVFSFILAGIAALLSAFSYAEFGARFPRAGSAYTYTYIGFGEIWAFIVGWTIPLEYMIGNAAVARSWSAYFDNLLDNYVKNTTIGIVGELSQPGGFFSTYPDVLSFVLICLCACVIAIGSRVSANVNTSFVILNILVIIIVIISGMCYADFNNWTGTTSDGRSNFFPYGVTGTLTGAATCFFSYIGFEVLATAGEEVKSPHRTIPVATFLSIGVIMTLYILVSSTLTLMVPYDQVHTTAPFAEAFDARGCTVVKYIISIGALVGLTNNLVTGVFALPRSVYAMADDGLLFGWLAHVNSYTKVPLNAIVIFTLINAVIALIFDIEALVEFLSIGTLFAYSFVSASVLVLRYQSAPIDGDEKRMDGGGELSSWIPARNFWESLPSGTSISLAVGALIASFFWLSFTFRTGFYESWYGQMSIGFNGLCIVLIMAFILGHTQNSLKTNFKVPCVPFLPCLSLLVNVFMMSYLTTATWIRLFVWMGVGLLIYFAYGIRHSKEAKRLTTIADIRMSSTFPNKNNRIPKT
ncbi:hypothetical protein GCK72_006761 [Caenorhabditis remanei]|uniref:Cationic amino acid transporter C-terminal domain-containing protein n=1 Tax=Caenorhabditis remanei TaxID=31234 RepID=A0A6A5HK84_CAERE|nr:hypothetical protein GCK72_006761 [Caenorhabditis remanei]KAF1766803.1 hypothetical protein GCK72_006761 [Caenorhabditis remanei]